jgi:uncharacterized protein (DUF779 family)
MVTDTGRMRELGLPRLRATTAAEEALARVVHEHGPVLLVVSAGCCGGSAPMCFPVDEFHVGGQDVLVGTVADCPVYVARRQLEAWPHVELLIDVEPGMPEGFSLAAGEGRHFVCWSSSVPMVRGDST